ncbi:MAG: hypothetical protein K2Q34_03130 [Alphaproteobacteria bacterium]|nr:hypothetical protein [Alphaproteobacteria bacterium]
MMSLYRYFIIALCLCNFIASAADNPYWDQYLKDKKVGKVANLNEHIQSLYTLPETGISMDALEERQKALSYFLSTGGKKGFRKTKTPPEEKAILENAHLFLGMVSEIDPFSFIESNLRDVYRYYSLDEGDSRVYKHFTIAQQYFTVGRMIAKWQLHQNSNYLKMILSDYYILTRLRDEFAKGNQIVNLVAELESFTNRFTPALVKRGLNIWNKISNTLQDPGLPVKPSITQETDNSALRQVLNSTDTIVRDTLAYHHARKTDTTDMPSCVHVPSDWSPLPIKKGSRPMVISLQDGTLIIKRADNTLFAEQAKSRVSGWRNQVKYLGDKGPQTIIEDSQALTDREILDKLGTISPVSSYFYYGKEGDYDDLSLTDVWPEPFLFVYPKTKGIYSRETMARETPNMELIKGLEEECIKECEDGIRKLGLPSYKSPFVNNKALIGRLSQKNEQLLKLSDLEGMVDEYTEYCEDLEHEIKCAARGIILFYMPALYQTEQSQLHVNKIRKLAFDVLKKMQTGVGKIKYLSKIPCFGPNYPIQETYEQKDVASNTLPSDPKVEEGEAEIIYHDGVLHITAKTNFTVLTFAQFWIGVDAKVTINLPTDDSIISIYQRSGKPDFRLGELARNQGKLKIYSPWAQGTIQCANFQASRGAYVTKSARRYPVNLEGFHDNDYERFTEDSRLKDVVAVDDFLSTPEGQFEQELLAFREKFVPMREEEDDEDAPRVLSAKEAEAESTPEKIVAYKDFMKVCEVYKEKGVRYAQTIEGEIQYELAARLCVSVQNLPFEEGFPVFKEAIQLWEFAEENGFRKAAEEREKIKMAMATWFFGSAQESVEVDESIRLLKEGIEFFETKSTLTRGESGSDDFPSDKLRKGMKNNLAALLIKKTETLLKQKPLPTTEVENFLNEAEILMRQLSRCSQFSQAASANLEALAKFRRELRGIS